MSEVNKKGYNQNTREGVIDKAEVPFTYREKLYIIRRKIDGLWNFVQSIPRTSKTEADQLSLLTSLIKLEWINRFPGSDSLNISFRNDGEYYTITYGEGDIDYMGQEAYIMRYPLGNRVLTYPPVRKTFTLIQSFNGEGTSLNILRNEDETVIELEGWASEDWRNRHVLQNLMNLRSKIRGLVKTKYLTIEASCEVPTDVFVDIFTRKIQALLKGEAEIYRFTSAGNRWVSEPFLVELKTGEVLNLFFDKKLKDKFLAIPPKILGSLEFYLHKGENPKVVSEQIEEIIKLPSIQRACGIEVEEDTATETFMLNFVHEMKDFHAFSMQSNTFYTGSAWEESIASGMDKYNELMKLYSEFMSRRPSNYRLFITIPVLPNQSTEDKRNAVFQEATVRLSISLKEEKEREQRGYPNVYTVKKVTKA